MAASSSSFSWSIFSVISTAYVVRLLLAKALINDFTDYLGHADLVRPVVSNGASTAVIHQIQHIVHVKRQNPYDVMMPVISPIFAQYLDFDDEASTGLSAVTTAADVLAVLAVWAAARSVTTDKAKADALAAAIAWNPWCMLACVGRAIAMFESALLLCALAAAGNGNAFASAVMLAGCTCLLPGSLLPFLLVLPCMLLLAKSATKCLTFVASAVGVTTALALLNASLCESWGAARWSWLQASFQANFQVNTPPNMGLSWYLQSLIEAPEAKEAFQAAMYVAPCMIAAPVFVTFRDRQRRRRKALARRLRPTISPCDAHKVLKEKATSASAPKIAGPSSHARIAWYLANLLVVCHLVFKPSESRASDVALACATTGLACMLLPGWRPALLNTLMAILPGFVNMWGGLFGDAGEMVGFVSVLTNLSWLCVSVYILWCSLAAESDENAAFADDDDVGDEDDHRDKAD